MDLSQFNKQNATSFNQQKHLLKQLAKGKTLLCEQCRQPITLNLATENMHKGHVCCRQGCTYIELDLA